MDLSPGELFPVLENEEYEDPADIMHHYNMMICSSHANNDLFDFDDYIFQPSDDVIFANDFKSVNRSWSESVMEAKIRPGQIISFGNSDNETKPKLEKDVDVNGNKRWFGSTSNNEHVVAERRRREKMTQGFLALSALIPGLKKTDKASILSETAIYLKQLEERAKVLDEKATKRTVESVCLVKKIQNQTLDDDDDTNYSSYKTIINNPDDDLEIEARFLNNNILIRVHSIKKEGLIQILLEEIGKLNLITLNCQTVPFGTYAIDITIIAQASGDFDMTLDGLVQHLGNAFQQHTV